VALEFAGRALRLSPDDIAREAVLLSVDPAAVHAVCDIEAGGAGFLPDSRPKILFEAHVFHRLTHGQYDGKWPNISSASWNRALYGPGGAHQYMRLQFAVALDRAAALQSCSWGMFQVMGTNHQLCGFDDVEAFVAAMMQSEGAHLDAFAAFCRANNLDRALRSHDWSSFARGYNGSGQVGLYASRLDVAYRKWTTSRLYSLAPRASNPTQWTDSLDAQELARH
jgi:hypothetical protein